ncbi:T9SS sorting signal type C domain-containing protein [Flavobacterium antarcticum]|uniref:T9SS sorting signal type C domain-containing protein n=1 Tax=Flavobacterium antarcticum TaxID=271155 RepID=UPI00373FC7B9
MKTGINTMSFESLTMNFRIYFSRYLAAGSNPDKEYVSVEVSVNGGATFTPLATPIKYSTSQGNPGNFALKTIDISSYKNQANLKFRIRYRTDTWADGVAVDDIAIYGSKKLTASYSWSGTDVSVYTDAALQNIYTPGTAIAKVYVVPKIALLELPNFNIDITTTLTNGCTLFQSIPVTNNAKIWAGTSDTSWSNPSNWKPAGVPSSTNCIIIPDILAVPVISGGATVTGKTLTVKNNAVVNVPSASTLTIMEGINVNTGGTLEIFDGGSLIQVANVENSSANNNLGSIKMHRITKPMLRYDYSYWSSPIYGNNNSIPDIGEFTLNNLSPNTLQDKYYSWNGGWVMHYGGNVEMNPGKGYIVRAPQSYNIAGIPNQYAATLIGKPNNGTVRTTIAAASTSWNLLGNPYPSAIDATMLLAQNPNMGGTLYFWTHNTPVGGGVLSYTPNDYASWNGTGGAATKPAPSSESPLTGFNADVPSGYIAAGQAFFVSGNDAGSEVVFNNDMRFGGANNNQFFKPMPTQPVDNWATTGKHRVWLNMKGVEKGFNQILVGYIENATNGYDNRYDGESFGGNFITFYSILENKNLVIQGRSLPFVNTDTVPLGYQTTLTGNLIISIDQVDGLLNGQDIYLQDNLLNVIHDLKASDYTFATIPGTFNTRFVLRYMPQETLDNPTFNEQIKGVVIRKNDAILHVSSPFEIIHTVSVYDITGRLVFEKTNCNTNTFDASHIVYADQTLIVKVKLSNGGVVTQKVF